MTVWHITRWLDVLGTRAFTGRPAREEVWHTRGWQRALEYEPDGLGYAGWAR